MAFKKYDTKANWYTNEPSMNYRIRNRSMPTISGDSPFKYFDGATMMSYTYASKASGVVFCRRDPPPQGCSHDFGINVQSKKDPIAALNLKGGSTRDQEVCADVDIPGVSNAELQKQVSGVHVEPEVLTLAKSCKFLHHWAYDDYIGKGVEMFLRRCGGSFSHGVSILSNFPLALTYETFFANSGCLNFTGCHRNVLGCEHSQFNQKWQQQHQKIFSQPQRK